MDMFTSQEPEAISCWPNVLVLLTPEGKQIWRCFTEDAVKYLFAPFGQVPEVQITKRATLGQNADHIYVAFATLESVDSAIAAVERGQIKSLEGYRPSRSRARALGFLQPPNASHAPLVPPSIELSDEARASMVELEAVKRRLVELEARNVDLLLQWAEIMQGTEDCFAEIKALGFDP